MRSPPLEPGYYAARAKAALESARTASNSCARIAHTKLAAIYALRAANDDREASSLPIGTLAFPLRSIPLWMPTER
jgi:hypothetical protein